jgi:hypothetical protein
MYRKTTVSSKTTPPPSNKDKTPYCGACFNAGKPKEEYTSHWTRSSKATNCVIVCPLILSSECGFCHELGHWTKFCPLIEEEKQQQSKPKTATTVAAIAPLKQPVFVKQKQLLPATGKNVFACLDLEDDEETDNEPRLLTTTTPTATAKATTPALDLSSVVEKLKKHKDMSEYPPIMGTRSTPTPTPRPPKMNWAQVVIDNHRHETIAQRAAATATATKLVVEKKEAVANENPFYYPPLQEMKTQTNTKKARTTPLRKITNNWADCSSSSDDDDDYDTVMPTGAFA